MRSFKEIMHVLGDLPNMKKIYLLGSTGAGKSSLVQKIIGTSNLKFPTTSHRRTTVAPTEYVISKDIPFKTTIVLKKKQEVLLSIQELLESAIIRAKTTNLGLKEIIYELEQSPDERFKLKYILSQESIVKNAEKIFNNILPIVKGIDQEEVFLIEEVQELIKTIIEEIDQEIETHFNNKCSASYDDFQNKPFIIYGIKSKNEFIIKNKELLANDYGSISALVEYIRIEGDLLSDDFQIKLDFVLIDGEGIGHSLSEKRDVLSTRHHEYFNYCDNIVLIENAEEPFTTGGQGAIESIILNGYQNKLKLVFSKIDKLSLSDLNSYFRRNLRNLTDALKHEGVTFDLENKNTFKLSNLNKEIIEDSEKREISKLLISIFETIDSNIVPLEYDFNNLFNNLDRERFFKDFQRDVNFEHWTVIKAFSRRMLNFEFEYKHIKPISWILKFIMQDINIFLSKDDDYYASVAFSQNKIKQEFSKKLIRYIYNNFIVNKDYLWQQAYDKRGIGSDKERKNFIFNSIFKSFLPNKDDQKEFSRFKKDIEMLLIESGAQTLKSAVKVCIKEIDIKKIYGRTNLRWKLQENVNILLGKNGSGKSTVIKLIDAFINNKLDVYERYGQPYLELVLTKEYENEDKQEIKLNTNNIADINSVLISTFDVLTSEIKKGETYLDSKLNELINEFGMYQRELTQIISEETKEETILSNQIRDRIATANHDELLQYQKLLSNIDDIKERVNSPLRLFTDIINSYFNTTDKLISIYHAREPLLILLKNDNSESIINIRDLSSGEKQLLIIFLTILLQRQKPFILLMDEPETSLHVEWQSTLIDNILRVQPNIQIIIATHNPLLTLNRDNNEIGIIKPNNEEIYVEEGATKYLDISSILLKYFGLSSLIGKDMQNEINQFTDLKLKEIEGDLADSERQILNELAQTLGNTVAGDIIYNEKYFAFLQFLKNEKNISYTDISNIEDQDFEDFLKEFNV